MNNFTRNKKIQESAHNVGSLPNTNLRKPERKGHIYELLLESGVVVQLFPGCSFDGVSFTGCDLTGLLLSGSNFENCDFSSCNLSWTDLSNCNLQGTKFDNSVLNRTIFAHSQLSDSSLLNVEGANTRFDGADVSFCVITGTLVHSDFSETKIVSSEFKDVDLSSATFVHSSIIGTSFHNCKMYKSVFIEAGLACARFEVCNMSRIVFQGATLTKVDFVNLFSSRPRWNFQAATLEEVCFDHCDLDYSDFEGSSLTNVTFEHSQLFGSDFSSAHLTNVQFLGTGVNDSDFSDSTWVKVTALLSRFRRGDFKNASIFETSISNSVIHGAQLEDATCVDLSFTECTFDTTNSWPSGFVVPTNKVSLYGVDSISKDDQ